MNDLRPIMCASPMIESMFGWGKKKNEPDTHAHLLCGPISATAPRLTESLAGQAMQFVKLDGLKTSEEECAQVHMCVCARSIEPPPTALLSCQNASLKGGATTSTDQAENASESGEGAAPAASFPRWRRASASGRQWLETKLALSGVARAALLMPAAHSVAPAGILSGRRLVGPTCASVFAVV